ncbi:MAG TPA: hypothetical protein VHP32_04460 [Ignavibacteria bacterium]|nr:hypothetical protein [Ignavibacteria bacterium]
MIKTIKNIEELISKNIIKKYAVGGAFASIFYIEPIATFDLDIFVIIKTEDAKSLNPLKEIYAWAKEKNFPVEKEHILIEGIPVQFLPVYNELTAEAVENAAIKKFDGEDISVISPEYLIAIMIDTFRGKDRERAIRFLNEATIDKATLDNILNKYNLKDKFDKLNYAN